MVSSTSAAALGAAAGIVVGTATGMMMGVAIGAEASKRMAAQEARACDAEQECAELHQLFEAWIRGESEDFAPIEARFDEEFQMVQPDGEAHSRESFLAQVRKSKASTPSFRITIEGLTEVEAGVARLLRYERQDCIGECTRRYTCSSVLRGGKWLQMQKSPLPGVVV